MNPKKKITHFYQNRQFSYKTDSLVKSSDEFPCRFTQEELLVQIEAAREEYKRGDVVTWEQLKKDWASW